VAQVTRLVDGLPLLSVDARLDFRDAASIYRACRLGGTGVRNLADCLIAAVAIRNDVTLAHKDADFDAVARVTRLRTLSWR
jgi:predicted nucleic acid-binding protein